MLVLLLKHLENLDEQNELNTDFYFAHPYSSNSYPTSIYKRQVHAYLDDEDVTKENPAYYGPAGSMLMDIQDLLTWAEALFTPGKILSKNSLEELLQTQAAPSSPPKPYNARYGLGVYSLEIPGYGLVWWYTGVVNGYSSIYLINILLSPLKLTAGKIIILVY